MNIYPLAHLVSIARQHCPFYRRLYHDLPSDYQLEDLPIADFDAVMAAVQDDPAALFATTTPSGMFYTTSGTTGKPKATLFGRDEWRTANRLLAETHWKNGLLADNDIILNLSEPGSASYLAVNRVADAFPGRCAEIPLGCDHDFEQLIGHYQHFGANVITGMNPTFLGLAHRLLKVSGPDHRIKRLLGGGENLIGSQLSLLREAFPSAVLYPFLYGTTETGLAAFSRQPTEDNAYIPFHPLCKIEIVDPLNRQVITETGVSGTLLVTSFIRQQTPAIRLDTGDQAQWLDPPERVGARFSLLGRRAANGFTVAGEQIDSTTVQAIAATMALSLPLLMLQLRLTGTDERPALEFLLSLFRLTPTVGQAEQVLFAALKAIAPQLLSAQHRGAISLITIQTVDFAYFENATKRKTRFIADLRRTDLAL